nr:hypothetical protein [Desulfobacterales bacterium]
TPTHPTAIKQLYLIAKQQPSAPAFQPAAARYLHDLVHRPPAWDQVPGVYSEYLRLSGAPRLPLALYPPLAGVLADKGHPEDAGRILSAMIKKQPLIDGLPAALYKLAAAFQKKGQMRQAEQCRRLLAKRYPQSPEARAAASSRP